MEEKKQQIRQIERESRKEEEKHHNAVKSQRTTISELHRKVEEGKFFVDTQADQVCNLFSLSDWFVVYFLSFFGGGGKRTLFL